MTGRQFGVDWGGAPADIVARRPGGRPVTRGSPTENPARYADPAVAVVRAPVEDARPPVDTVRTGTTVATTAFLPARGSALRSPRTPQSSRQAGEEINDLRAF
ncbi:hydantoinase/oxoprolinase N-terminal domain-containing protein [Streptomyces sp. NPDC060000]|uniref:hydantoinase/oxoprolinase N-terminal domain-containing protein n=1 Tax=Streptomyces sp. NPDC060000 TaxID=3347031 RepID=UPI003691A29A